MGGEGGVSDNPDPQVESYSYVNLVTAITLGPASADSGETRQSARGLRAHFRVVGCSGTLTSYTEALT
jgi:hypothetical protein